MSEGFIEECTRYTTKYIPTSYEWAESISTSLLSTAAGSNKYVKSKIGPLPMNIWFLMIGPSGFAYKSTPLIYVALPILARLTKRVEHPTILPSRYSLEGMIEYMANVCSQGCIVRDEFTTLFKQLQKGYLADSLEFMSELYDGTMQKRYTRKAKLEEALDVYVSFLSATTPYLYRVMKPDFFVQGTGNRILFINHDLLDDYPKENKSVDEEWEEWLRVLGNEWDNRFDQMEEFAEKLGMVHNSAVEKMVLLPEAAKEWLRYKRRVNNQSKKLYKDNKYDLRYTYMVRLPEFALKLGGLHTLSLHYTVASKLKQVEMPIMKEDVQWAIQKVDRHYEHFKAMLPEWDRIARRKITKTQEDLRDSVIMIIRAYGGRVLWTKISRGIGIYGDDFRTLMKGLRDAEYVNWGTETDPKTGREGVYVWLSKDWYGVHNQKEG